MGKGGFHLAVVALPQAHAFHKGRRAHLLLASLLPQKHL